MSRSIGRGEFRRRSFRPRVASISFSEFRRLCGAPSSGQEPSGVYDTFSTALRYDAENSSMSKEVPLGITAEVS